MSSLQKVNLGTPPTAVDGDTARGANTKMNANVDVLNAQAAITSNAALITAPQALTAAHVGKRVNVNLAAAGTINLPTAAVMGLDGVIHLRNVGATLVTLAVATGSGDTIALTRLNGGESALMDSDGIHAVGCLMRGASSTGNVTFPDGTVVVSAPIAKNLLLNPRGRINTRTYGNGAATGAAKQYTLDRWRVLVAGQALSWSDDGAACTFTAPAGGVEQIVQGADVAGGSYCLSWAGTATAKVNGTVVTSGSTFALPVGTNASVVFSSGTFKYPNLQPGTVPSGYEFVDTETDRARCAKYSRVISADSEGWGGLSQNAILSFNYDPMRTNPVGALAWKTTPVYGGNTGSPPTWVFTDKKAQMTVALSAAAAGAWFVVGYDVLLDAEINT